MDFVNVLESVTVDVDSAINPFAAKDSEGAWIEGTISISWLNEHFGQYSIVQEMIDATESEGLKLFFAWLRDEGKLP